MTIDELIYKTARAGTNNNPGLPPALAALVVAQAKHETGNFTSNFFKRYNNAFGYSYYPASPYQIGAGTVADNGLKIAAYAAVQDSVKELIDWLYRRVNDGKFPALDTITTPEKYAGLLKSAGYYGDTLQNYTAGLKRFFFEHKTVAGAGLIAVLFALFLLIKKTR